MYNLRNRSFLKESDFTARELDHLLRLTAALKARSTPSHHCRVYEPAPAGLTP